MSTRAFFEGSPPPTKEKGDPQRYYYKEICSRFRVYDSTETCGANHLCRSDCMRDIDARTICYFMNLGFPYNPQWNYKSIKKYEQRQKLYIRRAI
jgi:hypothetical protein